MEDTSQKTSRGDGPAARTSPARTHLVAPPGSGAADSFLRCVFHQGGKLPSAPLPAKPAPEVSRILAPALLSALLFGCPASKLRRAGNQGLEATPRKRARERRDEDSTQGDRRAGPAGDGGQRHRLMALRMASRAQGPGAEGRRAGAGGRFPAGRPEPVRPTALLDGSGQGRGPG